MKAHDINRLNFASWVLLVVGVFFIILVWLVVGMSGTRTYFILGIGMILLGIVLQSISFQYFKQDNKEDVDNTP